MTSPPVDRNDDLVTLTSAGKARRAMMLASLHAAMRRRHAQRRVLSAAVAGAGLVLVTLVGWQALGGGRSDRAAAPGGGGTARVSPGEGTEGPSPEVIRPGDAPNALAVGLVRVRPIETRVGIAERWAARPSGSLRVTVISDDDLVALAAERGEYLGLMRTGGVTALVAHQQVRPLPFSPDGPPEPDAGDEETRSENPAGPIPNHSW